MKKIFITLLLASTYLLGMQAQNTEEQDKSFRLTLMSFNIRNGVGMDDKTDLTRTARVIKHVVPDIVALQEVDSMTQRFDTDIAKNLAEMVGMYHYYAPAINFQGGKYGIGLLSVEKAISTKSLPLPGREEERVLLIAEFKKYVVFATHFSLTAEDQLASCNIVKSELAKVKNKPVFFMGDLNAHPNSDIIRNLDQHFMQLNNSQDCTFPASEPNEHIDYIYIAPKNRFIERQFEYVYNDPFASDHRPVVVGVEVK